jgi:hypothetical protein
MELERPDEFERRVCVPAIGREDRKLPTGQANEEIALERRRDAEDLVQAVATHVVEPELSGDPPPKTWMGRDDGARRPTRLPAPHDPVWVVGHCLSWPQLDDGVGPTARGASCRSRGGSNLATLRCPEVQGSNQRAHVRVIELAFTELDTHTTVKWRRLQRSRSRTACPAPPRGDYRGARPRHPRPWVTGVSPTCTSRMV